MRADWRLPQLAAANFDVVPVTAEGLHYIAENLRVGDREEIHATSGHRRYEDALHLCCMVSSSAQMAVNVYGVPFAVGGVSTVSLLGDRGSPWLMATDDADRFGRALVAFGRLYTAAMLEQYRRLENHVDARNTRSVAWLRRIGFTVGEAAPYGVFGLPFHKFWTER